MLVLKNPPVAFGNVKSPDDKVLISNVVVPDDIEYTASYVTT